MPTPENLPALTDKPELVRFAPMPLEGPYRDFTAKVVFLYPTKPYSVLMPFQTLVRVYPVEGPSVYLPRPV